MTSRDGLYCLECVTSGFNSQTSLCNPCPANTQIFGKTSSCTIVYPISLLSLVHFLLVDVLPSNQSDSGSRSCVECPPGSWADSAGSSCIPCGLTDCTQCVRQSHLLYSFPAVLLFATTHCHVFLYPSSSVSSGCV